MVHSAPMPQGPVAGEDQEAPRSERAAEGRGVATKVAVAVVSLACQGGSRSGASRSHKGGGRLGVRRKVTVVAAPAVEQVRNGSFDPVATGPDAGVDQELQGARALLRVAA